MIHEPMDVLVKYPVRKTKQQKTAFIEGVTSYAQNLGYAVNVESGRRGVRNIVIGEPTAARYLVTAHYDTPASIGLPNLIAPNNPVMFILLQLVLVAVIFAVAVAAGLTAAWIGCTDKVAYFVGYLVYFGILILMLKGPANRNNANDNTSGVVTVLETLSAVSEELRDHVCFVLFDMEEAGLVGSAIYRKLHKTVTESQIVLNLDCVGNGGVIQFTPVKKARKDQVLLESLSKICGKTGKKSCGFAARVFMGDLRIIRIFPWVLRSWLFNTKKASASFVAESIHGVTPS